MVDVPVTPAFKAFSLMLVVGSRQTATPSLRLNEPKPPERQRPDPWTESLLDLVQPSSPFQSQPSAFLGSNATTGLFN